MRIGKRIYFDSREERIDFLSIVKEETDVISISSIISSRYHLEFPEAMEIAKVYIDYMRKENKEGVVNEQA